MADRTTTNPSAGNTPEVAPSIADTSIADATVEQSPLVETGFRYHEVPEPPTALEIDAAIEQAAYGLHHPRNLDEQDSLLSTVDALAHIRAGSEPGQNEKVEIATTALRGLYEETHLLDVKLAVIHALRSIGADDPETRSFLAEQVENSDYRAIEKAAAEALHSISAKRAAA